MKKRYKVDKHNSTVCGYPGRDFDWSKFDWEGKSICKTIFIGGKDYHAPLPYIDNYLITTDCEYLHVPYNFEGDGTIYRVRPNPSMYAGEIYRGHKVVGQKAVKVKGICYWELEYD